MGRLVVLIRGDSRCFCRDTIEQLRVRGRRGQRPAYQVSTIGSDRTPNKVASVGFGSLDADAQGGGNLLVGFAFRQ
jgi:hypothetical protein